VPFSVRITLGRRRALSGRVCVVLAHEEPDARRRARRSIGGNRGRARGSRPALGASIGAAAVGCRRGRAATDRE
jgi:hypothetical protein